LWPRSIPSAEFDVTTRISTVAPGHDFKTEGKVLTSPGWLAVYGKTTVDDDSPDAKALPALTPEDKSTRPKTAGCQTPRRDHQARRRATRKQPCSPRWKAPASWSTTRRLAEAMKERGLGTPATRADTIEGLINQKYLDRATSASLCPQRRPSQLLEFLAAVKADEPHEAPT
jgi:DNA topoisomerase-3